MAKTWYSSKELAVIEGLPSTTQGINRKARMENWVSRKRNGIQGKAVEYHIDSLPHFVREYLNSWETPTSYTITPLEPLQLWTSIFIQLSETEQETVSNWLIRNGVIDLLAFIENEKNSN